ncbi:hypothetical protein ABZ897_60365 [Nonomuraea sp. NPDC046802]|uniref:hypothetical protein n=1 Tax=Nonomuraea sp. NPDC046802 TaxID=3154919 RepID=UPI0033C5A000
MEIDEHVRDVKERAQALANDRVTAVVDLARLDHEIEKDQARLAGKLKAREELYSKISGEWSGPELRNLGIRPDGAAHPRTATRPRGRARRGTAPSAAKNSSAPTSDDGIGAKTSLGKERDTSPGPAAERPRPTGGPWPATPQT